VDTNKLLGTGKIAKLFKVSPRTVAKWIDEGILVGSRIPGSRHRRVAWEEVTRFAKQTGLTMYLDPTPELPDVSDPLSPAVKEILVSKAQEWEKYGNPADPMLPNNDDKLEVDANVVRNEL